MTPTGEHGPSSLLELSSGELELEDSTDPSRPPMAPNYPASPFDSESDPGVAAPGATTVEPVSPYLTGGEAPPADGFFPGDDESEQGLSYGEELDSAPTRIERSEDIQPPPQAAPTPETPRVVIIGGNNRGQEHVLKPRDNSMGRGMDNDIILADIAVSRKHTLICFESGQFVVRDLGSGNGTLLNGQRVDYAPLTNGDQLELGNTLLRFVAPEAPPEIASLQTVVTPRELAAGALPSPGTPGFPPAGVALTPERASAPTLSPESPAAVPAAGRGAAAGYDPYAASSPPQPRRDAVRASPGTSRIKLPLKGAIQRLLDTRTKKIAVLGGGGVTLLLVLMIVIKGVSGGPPAPPPGPPTPPPDQLVAQAFNDGITQYNAQNWEAAREHFLKALEIAPNQEHVRQYVDKATAELEAKGHLDQAQEKLKANDFAAARKAIAAISTNSTYHRDSSTLAQKVDEAEVAALLKEAAELGEADKPDEALELLKRALSISPTNKEAKERLAELSEAEDEPQRPRRHHRRPHRRPTPRTHSRPAPPAGRELKEALSLYRQRQWGPAYKAVREVADGQRGGRRRSAEKLGKDISAVGQSWIRAEQTSDLGQRLKLYNKALAHDRNVPGKPHQGTLRDNIVRTAKAQISSALSRGQYPAAYAAVKLGQKYGDSGSFQSALATLERKAKDLFTEGYTIRHRDINKARKLWQTVLRMVPPSSLTYQKTYSYLNNAGPSYQDEDEE